MSEDILKYFSYFSLKTFDILCKLPPKETICMKRFVLFRFYITFNTLSVISWWVSGVAESSMLTSRVLPHWNFTPPTHVTLSRHWTNQFWFLALLTYCWGQMKQQLVPFLKPLVWLDQGFNQKPPGHKVDSTKSQSMVSEKNIIRCHLLN